MLSALDDPANHSAPILDTFLDQADDTISYIVMPFLRLSDNPPFETVCEVVDFVDQVLEVHLNSLSQEICAAADLIPGSRFHSFTRSCPSVRPSST